jgi:hypothetical protein
VSALPQACGAFPTGLLTPLPMDSSLCYLALFTSGSNFVSYIDVFDENLQSSQSNHRGPCQRSFISGAVSGRICGHVPAQTRASRSLSLVDCYVHVIEAQLLLKKIAPMLPYPRSFTRCIAFPTEVLE